MITVYTLPSCQPCKMTKREFDRLGLAYEEVPMDTPGVAERLTEAGHRAAPVVETPDQSWSGFQPSKIRALAAA